MEIQESFLQRIREIASEFNPNLKCSTIYKDDDALVNDVFIVDEAYVFRFPKNEDAKTILAREVQLLDVLHCHVTLSIPMIEYCSEDCVIYPYLSGKPLYWHDWLHMKEQDRETVAYQLALFLQQINTIPADELINIELAGPNRNRSNYYFGVFEAVKEKLYPFLWKDQKVYIEHLFEPVLSGELDLDSYRQVLRHNDLASYHILYSPNDATTDQYQLSGILDFGTAGWGDLADDLSILINTYGERFVNRMVPYYSEIAPVMARARFKAVAIEIEWALKGVGDKDLEWLLVHLGRARDISIL